MLRRRPGQTKMLQCIGNKNQAETLQLLGSSSCPDGLWFEPSTGECAAPDKVSFIYCFPTQRRPIQSFLVPGWMHWNWWENQQLKSILSAQYTIDIFNNSLRRAKWKSSFTWWACVNIQSCWVRSKQQVWLQITGIFPFTHRVSVRGDRLHRYQITWDQYELGSSINQSEDVVFWLKRI